MTCREVAEFLADYLNGELPMHERAVFEDHLARCPNCREYLAVYRTTVTLGRHAFDDLDVAEASIPEGLVAAILASRRSGAPPS